MPDVEKGFSVEGPELVVETDNVTLNCAASKYTYNKDLEWLYMDSDKFLPITSNITLYILLVKVLFLDSWIDFLLVKKQ